MSSKYQFSDNSHLYFVSFAVVNWIDAFTRKEYKDILIKSLQHCQLNKGLELYAWVIMANHVHLIIGSAKNNLSDIMRDMKKHTSLKLKNAILNNAYESRKEWMMELFYKAGKANSNNVSFNFGNRIITP